MASKRTFTAEEIKAATNADTLTLRKCPTCRTPLIYRFDGDDLVLLSACGCLVEGQAPRPSNFAELADYVGAQRPQTQARILRDLAGKAAR